MKLLITGATGFIGRNLVEQLSNEYEVVSPNHMELDLQDEKEVYKVLKKEKFNIVIHAANVNTSRKIETTDYESLNGNLQMFYNLEKHQDLYGKMLYFGSGAEYDMRNYIPNMKEDFFGINIPKDSYGFSKYIMSRQTEQSKNIYDLRLFGVYGRYEEWERRFISNAICRGLSGLPITIQQNVYFDYLWVDDLVKIVKWFIKNKPEFHHYNVCRGEKVDLLSLAKMVKEALELEPEIQIAKEGWKREYTGNNERLLNEMGGFVFSDYMDTIYQLILYYKTFGRIEVNKLL